VTARPASTWRLARLTLEAWLALAAFDVALAAGFARARALVRRSRVRTRRAPAAVDDVVWAVEEACVWYVKRVACLQRSAVAARLLSRHGVPADVVIGCRPAPFESHAWVEVHGRVVNDRPQYQRLFTVLERL
jgi:Transglutaminase-like superfamily